MVRRFIPQSLLGQVMLVLAVGLMVAQLISAFLLYQAAEQRRETALISSIAFRLVADGANPGREERRRARLAELRERGFEPGSPPRDRPLPRRPRFGIERTAQSPVEPGESRLSSFETGLRDVLDQQGIESGEILVTRRIASQDPYIRDLAERRPALRTPDWKERGILVASVQRADRSGWITVRLPEPRRPTGGPVTLIFQTLVIFTVLVLLLYLVLRRITRPLAVLTDRVGDFSRQPDRVVEIEESGPADTRRLIAAHNAMERRIAALLDEKDVMLGAIGHDLKTPLAALRVRIESVPDEDQRDRMASSIEDITRTLDDILSLARIGRNGGQAEALDLGALAIGVVEEFEDLNQPVSVQDAPRVVAEVQETWIKRALRNLVSNAVRYGECAKISVLEENGHAVLRVDDTGPGIRAGQIADMMEPFTRGEASRNRATGGAGLGLTLARAIAEQHGGALQLANRKKGGLRAEIRLPMQSAKR
ncbi:MAG: ATP-binding protein [Erythrobacter sp.]|nr:ATP-binding protein [Erythrobacter sp.]